MNQNLSIVVPGELDVPRRSTVPMQCLVKRTVERVEDARRSNLVSGSAMPSSGVCKYNLLCHFTALSNSLPISLIRAGSSFASIAYFSHIESGVWQDASPMVDGTDHPGSAITFRIDLHKSAC